MGKKRGALVVLVILFLMVVFWWVIAQLSVRAESPTLPITVHHSVSQKNHVYEGSVRVESGCVVLSSGISATGGVPAHVVLLLSTEDDTHCTQTSKGSQESNFSVSYTSSSAKTPVFDGVVLNGANVAYSLTEAQ